MFILVRRKRAARRASSRNKLGELSDDSAYNGNGSAIELQDREAVVASTAASAPRNQSENRPGLQVPPPTYGNANSKNPSMLSPREIISPPSPTEPPPYSPQEPGSTSEIGQGLGTTSPNEAFRLREEDRLLNERRASLRETLLLLEVDERFRTEQETVRRRLVELEKGSR